MEPMSELFEDAVTAFRRRLTEALAAMRQSRSPLDFCDAERLLLTLAHELTADMTQRVLQDVSDDRERAKGALARVRERAASRGIALNVQSRRRTLIRTVGGQQVEVVTPYATAQPRGAGRKKKRCAQGTRVYPVLDELGIAGRSTPAMRLLVSRRQSTVAASR